MMRTLGTIGQVGLVSENALEIAVVLKDCEWNGIVSRDGGQTWQIAQKAQLPAKLADLPLQGPIRYQLVGNDLILRSDDAGKSWKDVSPWGFLRHVIIDEVKGEKGRFMAKYGHWLPQDQDTAWQFGFGATAVLLTGLGGWRCRKLERKWLEPVVLSLPVYFLIGFGLLMIHRYLINWMCSQQWTLRQGQWDEIAFPKWPVGIFMYLSGDPWVAPITAIFLFPLTAMYSCIRTGESSFGQMTLRRLMAVAPVVGIVALLIAMRIPELCIGWLGRI